MHSQSRFGTLFALAVFAATALPGIAGDAIDPANFSSSITNPWMPLSPGMVLSYQGTKEGRPATLVVTVTDQTKEISGVKCRIVEEFVSLAGTPVDRTLVYYAQDTAGNVWYFGEDVQELDMRARWQRPKAGKPALTARSPP